jgi:hypothetical protein
LAWYWASSICLSSVSLRSSVNVVLQVMLFKEVSLLRSITFPFRGKCTAYPW